MSSCFFPRSAYVLGSSCEFAQTLAAALLLHPTLSTCPFISSAVPRHFLVAFALAWWKLHVFWISSSLPYVKGTSVYCVLCNSAQLQHCIPRVCAQALRCTFSGPQVCHPRKCSRVTQCTLQNTVANDFSDSKSSTCMIFPKHTPYRDK